MNTHIIHETISFKKYTRLSLVKNKFLCLLTISCAKTTWNCHLTIPVVLLETSTQFWLGVLNGTYILPICYVLKGALNIFESKIYPLIYILSCIFSFCQNDVMCVISRFGFTYFQYSKPFAYLGFPLASFKGTHLFSGSVLAILHVMGDFLTPILINASPCFSASLVNH